MARTLFQAILYATLLSTRVIAAEAKTAKVEIHATDLFGQGLDPIRVIRFAARQGLKDFSDKFAGPLGQNIPYGDYFVTISAGDIGLGTIAHVDGPSVFLVLSGSGWIIDTGTGARPGPLNHVIHLPESTKRPVWMKVVPLFNDSLKAVSTFRIADDVSFPSGTGGYELGEYFVTVSDAKDILFGGRFAIKKLNSQIEIDVGAGVINVR
jgi:hypothetical protein